MAATSSLKAPVSTDICFQFFDIRYNQLDNLEEIANYINSHESLISISFYGNKCSIKKDRRQFLSNLPCIKRQDSKLRFIDEEEITIEEAVQAIKVSGMETYEAEIFRFNLALNRKVSRRFFILFRCI
jgi:hypothetical protein